MISAGVIALACGGMGALAYAAWSAAGSIETPRTPPAPKLTSMTAGKVQPLRGGALGHTTPKCTGHWRIAGQHLACTSCGAEHLRTGRNLSAATDENLASIWLRRLTAEGAAAMKDAQ